MPSWSAIRKEAPDLAATVEARFRAGKHSTLATLRRDGSPRISGTEVEFSDGEMWLGSMPGAVKALDLRRDGRFALHSPTSDPDEDDPTSWAGEAKVAGLAVEVSSPEGAGGAHHFRLDITEVVFTHVVGRRLEIVSWHPGRGVEKRQRD